MDVIYKRVAGLDVHKETVVATVRVMVGGKVERECRTFETTTAGLSALLAWLTEAQCSHVAMEATGVYWKPVWNILSDGAFELIVANAAHIKNVPGRKTDVNDATRIADLLACGLVRGSFVREVPGVASPAAHAQAIDARADAACFVLIEAGPRVLPAFREHLSAYAQHALERLGVEVVLGEPVSECTPAGVVYGDKALATATIIWAAGVQASPAAEWLEAPADRAGRLKVEPDLTVPGHPEIFAIGDAAIVARPDGRPVPGIAPAAKQEGAYVAAAIRARLGGQPAPPCSATSTPETLRLSASGAP